MKNKTTKIQKKLIDHNKVLFFVLLLVFSMIVRLDVAEADVTFGTGLYSSTPAPAVFSEDIRGGFHTVATLNSMFSIFCQRRQEGMLVWVKDATPFGPGTGGSGSQTFQLIDTTGTGGIGCTLGSPNDLPGYVGTTNINGVSTSLVPGADGKVWQKFAGGSGTITTINASGASARQGETLRFNQALDSGAGAWENTNNLFNNPVTNNVGVGDAGEFTATTTGANNPFLPPYRLSVLGNLGLLKAKGTNVAPGPGSEIILESPADDTATQADSWTDCGAGGDTSTVPATCVDDTGVAPVADSFPGTFNLVGNGAYPDAGGIDTLGLYTCPASSGGIVRTDVITIRSTAPNLLTPFAPGVYFSQIFKQATITCIAGTSKYSLRTNKGDLEFLNNGSPVKRKILLTQDGNTVIGEGIPTQTPNPSGGTFYPKLEVQQDAGVTVTGDIGATLTNYLGVIKSAIFGSSDPLNPDASSVFMWGSAQPPLSLAGTATQNPSGSLYFDKTDKIFKISENGGPYHGLVSMAVTNVNPGNTLIYSCTPLIADSFDDDNNTSTPSANDDTFTTILDDSVDDDANPATAPSNDDSDSANPDQHCGWVPTAGGGGDSLWDYSITDDLTSPIKNINLNGTKSPLILGSIADPTSGTGVTIYGGTSIGGDVCYKQDTGEIGRCGANYVPPTVRIGGNISYSLGLFNAGCAVPATTALLDFDASGGQTAATHDIVDAGGTSASIAPNNFWATVATGVDLLNSAGGSLGIDQPYYNGVQQRKISTGSYSQDVNGTYTFVTLHGTYNATTPPPTGGPADVTATAKATWQNVSYIGSSISASIANKSALSNLTTILDSTVFARTTGALTSPIPTGSYLYYLVPETSAFTAGTAPKGCLSFAIDPCDMALPDSGPTGTNPFWSTTIGTIDVQNDCISGTGNNISYKVYRSRLPVTASVNIFGAQ